MPKPLLINIVSGKGGTGKSLISATLGRLLAQEGAKVILVDADVFVRGLTCFLRKAFEKKTITDKPTVSDFLGLSDNKNMILEDVSLERFFEIDLVPSVSSIIEELSYLESSSEAALHGMDRLFRILRNSEADIILIDNRAGVDSLIIETCKQSDVILSVSDADKIARVTNDNLIRHIKDKIKSTPYTILNKVAKIGSYDEYRRSQSNARRGFELIGEIPFDRNLADIFGEDYFWDKINMTKFAYSLSDTWNHLAGIESIKFRINMDRFPKLSLFPPKSPSFLSRVDSVSIFAGTAGLLAWLLIDKILYGGFSYKDIILVYALLMIAFPFLKRLLFDFKQKD